MYESACVAGGVDESVVFLALGEQADRSRQAEAALATKARRCKGMGLANAHHCLVSEESRVEVEGRRTSGVAVRFQVALRPLLPQCQAGRYASRPLCRGRHMLILR